jgi:hypothetical protein
MISRAVHQLVPKEFKIADSKEGLGNRILIIDLFMKKIFFTLVIIVACNSLYGQTLEWEILSVGFPLGIRKDKAGDVVWPEDRGFVTGTEIRYNYFGKRLSSGIQLTLTGWNRRSPLHNDNFTYHQNPFTFLLVTDYNYVEINPKKILPFAGIGVGYAAVNSWPLTSLGEESNVKSHFACSPRIGIEFFRRIRLTGEYQYAGNKNNYFNVKLGFVVGS